MILKITYLKLLLTLLFVASIGGTVEAQVCNGALGDPVVNIDFGRGTDRFGPSLGSNTSYNYNDNGDPGNPDDGDYAIAKTTSGMNPGWSTVQNHTPNDPDGYMMVVNASFTPGVFYESTTQIDLCPNTTYEFAAWIVNILRNDNGNKPNITFSILSLNDDVLQTFNTGDIANANPTWIQYGFLFRTTNISAVKLRMTNNGPGGGGNDLAIDDITFRACGPVVTAGINGGLSQEADICIGASQGFDLSASVSPGVYTSPEFLWQQKRDDGDWTDMPGETTEELHVDFEVAEQGVYQYRLLIAENGNINGVCRTSSNPFTITVHPPPTVTTNRSFTVCRGQPINLTVNSASSYLWTGPHGFTSAERSPIITSSSDLMQGIYTVTITSAAGCSNSASLTVTVIPPTDAKIRPITPICEGSSVTLQASGGLTYRWFPAEGLSATNISNPVASPSRSIVYTVVASNGVCENTAEVEVVVLKNPSASAGADKIILQGDSVVLDGVVQGGALTVNWTPAEGLSDSRIPNPVATPVKDMLYTITVSSICGVVTDQVFVRVYQTIKAPNAFSPNGDGTNDTWEIPAITSYERPTVKVMNRYGDRLFESTGYDKPWDGKHNGKDLPTGVYYFIIRLNDELKVQTGSVTILR